MTAWGHTALIDYVAKKPGLSPVWDWGNYDSSDPSVPVKFMQGEARFYPKRRTLQSREERYGTSGRTMYAQVLDFTEPQRVELFQRALASGLELQKTGFEYDGHEDNCTTRVRDLIDLVTRGAVQQQRQAPSTTSAKHSLLRHAGPHPHLWFAMHFGGGPSSQTPMSGWNAMYMPDNLMRGLEGVQFQGRDLVRQTCTWQDSALKAPPSEPPRWDGLVLAMAAASGLAIAAAGRLNRWLGRLATLAYLAVATFIVGWSLVWWGVGTFAPHYSPRVFWILVVLAPGLFGSVWAFRASRRAAAPSDP